MKALRLICFMSSTLGWLSASATTFYVANNGNDASSGTSVATPWRTVGRVNQQLPHIARGDAVLFRRGDVFRDDYIRCLNPVTVTEGTTLENKPPACSGSATARLTFGAYGTGAAPVIDGADPLRLEWTHVTDKTWSATLPGILPGKLYLASGKNRQLLPMPNATGNYDDTRTYQPFDAATGPDGRMWVHGFGAAVRGRGFSEQSVWVCVVNTNPENTSQTFSLTASGLENVNSHPGSWYVTGKTIYVHLQDGSDPNKQEMLATHRRYGVLLAGVNYVTVKDLAIRRVQRSGIASIPFPSDRGHYFTGEYLTIENNDIANIGDLVSDDLPMQDHVNHEVAGVLVRASGQTDPHFLRGILIRGNHIGTTDAYFGLRGQDYQAGIKALGIDGGGTANAPVIVNNYVSTHNASGIVYAVHDMTLSPGKTTNNPGGRVTGNEITDNQGNLFFSQTDGGMADHNHIHHSWGEGIQAGGHSLSTEAMPQVFAYNLIHDLGASASGILFNGFDCNGALPGGYWLHNTVYNTYAANITLEFGCTESHVHDNIFDQNALPFPSGTALNKSYLMYFVSEKGGDQHPDFSNNLWVDGTNPEPFHGTKARYTCKTFFSAFPDTHSQCADDARFVDAEHGDFHLQTSSPAVKAGEHGEDLGALSGSSSASGSSPRQND